MLERLRELANQRVNFAFEITLASREKISKALAQAVQDALLKHKQAGNPVATWRGGKVVWIPPEEIPIHFYGS